MRKNFLPIKVLSILALCITIVFGSAIRDQNELPATTSEPGLSQDEPEVTTFQSRVKREIVGTTFSPEILSDESDSTTLGASRVKREATTFGPEVFLDESDATTFQASRVKREATTIASDVYLDESDATTLGSNRVKREVTTYAPDTLLDESDATTIVESRVKREATTGVYQDEQDSTTVISSRVKREATTFGTDVFQDESDATTIVSRVKREATTGIYQDEQEATTIIASRVKREATTFGTEVFQDESDATTLGSNRVKREATTFSPEVSFDESEITTLGSRIKRDAQSEQDSTNEITPTQEAQANDEYVETTVSPRFKREIPDSVTEKISSNELFDDAVELTSQSSIISKNSEIDESEENFKYPTTPYPDPILENVTGPPILENESYNENPSHKMTAQNIILGNRSCECGTSVKKIVGGEAVPISDLPWTVALVRKSNKTRKGPYCGGTLVSNNYVVTASHCVDGFDAEKIEVWLNEEDFRVDDENLSGTIRVDVEEIIMHADYDRKSIDNDIALLRLAEPVDIEGRVRPACVPSDNSQTYEDVEGIVAGWGAKEQGGSVSATLQKVSVPILSNKVCNWRTLYLGRITDNQLCAGDLASGGKDSCQGDSGGPLVVSQGEAQSAKKILVGVVSYGFGCARPLAPGVYTRVGRFSDWILSNSKDAEYCSA